MKSELHLFIIWEKARYKEKEIIEDIELNFEIIKIYEVKWSLDNFSANLTRFYGVSLPKNSNKEKHCGNGPFLLIIVKDNNPIHKVRRTSKGSAIVNVNMFDSKEMYRLWTGGGHKIHATNSINETNHDLVLLLGTNINDFLKNNYQKYNGEIEEYNKDLIGCNGWNNISQFFYVLNSSIKYVLLRNFECLPNKYNLEDHGDIDLLTDNYFNMKCISNSKEVFNQKYRVHNEVIINNEKVLFDFRWLGDNYYDINWEKDILENRKLEKNIFYSTDEENYFYSLLYHALIHKVEISEDYIRRLLIMAKDLKLPNFNNNLFNEKDKLFSLLDKYLKSHNYRITEPYDLSVYFNSKLVGSRLSMRRKIIKPILSYKNKFIKLVGF